MNLRLSLPDRVAAFSAGLTRLGYRIELGGTDRPGERDILCSWGRIGIGDYWARKFEEAGRPVLVTENATWGNGFMGDRWLTLARNRHNTAGMFPVGGPERWDSLNVELAPWRTEGETVILAQRGIGSPPTRMPPGWPQQAQARHGGRIRNHPGRHPAKPLADDLAQCGKAVVWGSGAGVWAIMNGIPTVSEMTNWSGACEATDASRLAMLRTLAWGQSTLAEIESGEAFRRLLEN